MLIETTMKYYDKKYDLNCAECILAAVNEEYDLNISQQTLMTMSSFGGGMAIGSTCGAATGAIAALGVMFTNERGHNSPHVREMTCKFLNEFNKRMGNLDCISLKDKYFEVETRCEKIMKVSSQILEELVQEYIELYNINR